MNDLDPLPSAVTGRYRHYKGGEYEVLGVVRHSETMEPMVLYRALYGERGLWVRPYGMFFEAVQVDGVHRPRFVAETLEERVARRLADGANAVEVKLDDL